MAETAHKPVHPSRFDVFLGGYGQSNYRIVWDGDALQYYADDFAPPQVRDKSTETVCPSESQWRRFWHEMDAVELWEWRSSYNARDIMDGTQWEVEMEWGTRVVSTGGATAGERVADGQRTERFKRFAEAIRELLGDRPFG